MKKFSIEILTKNPEKIYDTWSVWGKITIADFSERFIMSLEDWKLEDYIKQWQQGIERLKKHDYSCLVINVSNLKKDPLVEMWNLYKEDNTTFFQNSLLIPETIEHRKLNLSNFNIKNCYDYVDFPKETHTDEGEKISEWKLSTSEVI